MILMSVLDLILIWFGEAVLVLKMEGVATVSGMEMMMMMMMVTRKGRPLI